MVSQLDDRHDSILRKPGAPIGARCEDVPVADLQRQRRLRNRMVDAAHHADVIEERGLGERVRARIVARLRRPVARDVPPRAQTAETQAILVSHLVDQRIPALLDRVERAQDAALPCGMQAAGVVATVQPLDRGATCAVVVCVEEVGHERHRDGLLVPCLAGERVPLQRGGGAVAELQEERSPRRIVEMPPRSREVERALLGEDGAVEHAGDEARRHQLCERRVVAAHDGRDLLRVADEQDAGLAADALQVRQESFQHDARRAPRLVDDDDSQLQQQLVALCGEQPAARLQLDADGAVHVGFQWDHAKRVDRHAAVERSCCEVGVRNRATDLAARS
mmetsp:Transcript_73450/g.201728  ORF Transcript_73450/g.201728 Transcript_73450/m.201728 type:complete len:336 (+) Transcript_73450:711-1718(+)